MKKKETKNKEKAAKNKQSLLEKMRNFFSGVKTEAKRIKWPNKKDMVKYSIATIVFIIGCSLFFYVIDVIIALLHTIGK